MITLESIPLSGRLLLATAWYAFIYYLTELPVAAPHHSLGYISEMTTPALSQVGNNSIASALSLHLPDFLNFIFRSLAHMFVFGIQGILVYYLFNPSFKLDKVSFWVVCILFIGILGWMDELHQGTVPGRTPRFVDVVKDCAGALLFVYAAIRLQSLLLTRKQNIYSDKLSTF